MKANETKAIRDLAETLPFGEEMKQLILEFLKGESAEAQLAQDADQIEMILTLKEHKDLGNKYADEWLHFALKRLKTDIAHTMAGAILDTDSSLWWFSDRSDWWVHGPKKDK